MSTSVHFIVIMFSNVSIFNSKKKKTHEEQKKSSLGLNLNIWSTGFGEQIQIHMTLQYTPNTYHMGH